MPLSRCQIKNEYSLADQELYKAADKDDPEALLEAVAMAGLVGVLRQLGDLAEFAAEVFHDLHEEVMATASRGHSLIVRVQQVEAEFPSIERTLLMQTSHTSFLYNSGVDWHRNLCVDQNLVTRRDLPRFIMDSYEECRGPPRLFLLDKFDVAGSGTCLKRYTDPSFFKTESISSNGRKSEAQREKKIRRVKKRVPHLRNDDTPEFFSSSHVKLHQLFLEERLENDGIDPERRVKLKRRQFTGSFLDRNNKTSYMEKFVDMNPQEQKIVTSIEGCESDLEIVEIGTVSPLKESIKITKSLCSSPDTRDPEMKELAHEFSERKLNEVVGSGVLQLPPLNHASDSCKILRLTKEECTDMESDSQSIDDGIASEIDNYVDALATIDSEFDTDLECKRTSRYLNAKPLIVEFCASEAQKLPRSLSSDSQSFGNSTTSEDGNNSFKYRENSSCSMSVNSIAESTKDLKAEVVVVPSVTPPKSDPHDIYIDHYFMSKGMSESAAEKHAMASNAVEADDFDKSHFEEASNTLFLTGPNTTVLPIDMQANLGDNSFPSSQLEEECSSFGDTCIIANQGAPMRTSIGNWYSGEHPLDDGTSHNISITPDDWVHLPQIECRKADSVSSLVKEHINAFGIMDMDVCSDIGQPHTHPPCSDAKHQDKMNPTNANEDFLVLSTGKSSERYSSPEHIQSFNIQHKLPEMKNCDQDSLFDSALVACSSSEDYCVKESLTDVEVEEKTSILIVSLTETLPPIYDEKQACGSEYSFSEISEAGETAEEMVSGPIRTENPFLTPYMRETHNQRQKLAEYDPVEHHQAEDWDQYPKKISDVHGDSFSVGGEEKGTLCDGILEGTSVSQNLGFVRHDNLEPVRANAYLDRKTQAILVGSTSEHGSHYKLADKSEKFPHKTFLSDTPSELAITSYFLSEDENYLTLDQDMAKKELIEIVANNCGQDDTENFFQEKAMLLSSEFVDVDKLKGQPVSLTEESIQSGEGMISEHKPDLAPQKDLDAPLGANSNMSLDGSSPLTFPDDSLAQVVQSGTTLIHSVEGPFISEIGTQDMETTLSNHDQLPLPGLQPQTAEFMMESFRKPLVDYKYVGPSNMPSTSIQVIPKVEKPGQLIPPSFPVSEMLPVEPPVNLEHPPLPPLPPMQWRLGRFQSSSNAVERQMVQYTPGPVQPMALQSTNIESEVVAKSPDTTACEGSDGNAAERGLQTLPKVPVSVTVSDVSSQINVTGIAKYSNSVTAAQIFTSSLNGNQALEESCPPSMNPTESGSVEAHTHTNDIVEEEKKLSTVVGSENGQPEHVPRMSEMKTVNHHSDHPLSSAAYNNWHSRGFEAPEETGRTLSSVHDGILDSVDGNANGTLQNKLPRPRNPLIDEVVAIDKSKFRKVERVKPLDSKGGDGESLLEQLQLRKVGKRTKSQVESKTEDMGPLLEQLQLRKVGERVKPEADIIPEGTESPRVQLRKVVGRAHSMVGPKTKDRDSLLEQIRNKSFNLRPAAMARPNIQGPSTNLRVSAILQKASNIRQAMAGSDEEDDADNWSDC